MSDQPTSVNFQTVNADPIAAAKENYERLIERIGNIVKQNHSYFVTLGALISSPMTGADNSCDTEDASFPNFINRAVTLQLNSIDSQLDECLTAFNTNNSAIFQSMLKISK